MNSRDRQRLYWLGCIPVRTLIAIIVIYCMNYQTRLRYWIALLSTTIGVGLLFNAVLSLAGLKTHGVFGGKVWWKRQRYAHAALWLLTGFLAFNGNKGAGLAALVDVFLAIVFGLVHWGLV